MQKPSCRWIVALLLVAAGFGAVAAEEGEAPKRTLFRNVNVFDGKSDTLIKADVLIESNLIKAIGSNLSARWTGASAGEERDGIALLAGAHGTLRHPPRLT